MALTLTYHLVKGGAEKICYVCIEYIHNSPRFRRPCLQSPAVYHPIILPLQHVDLARHHGVHDMDCSKNATAGDRRA